MSKGQETVVQSGVKPSRLHFCWFTLILLVTLLYSFKPDFSWAMVIFPVWTWTGLAAICILFSIRKNNVKRKLFWIGLWLIPTLLFSDEWFTLARSPLMSDQRGQFRVVSLNCAGGLISAANEVAAYKPDLVLLQESPSEAELEKLAKVLYGEKGIVVKGPDAAILAPASGYAIGVPTNRLSTASAHYELSNGQYIFVCSLRLQPPVFNPNLLSPDTWIDLAQNRQNRRKQLAALRQEFDDLAITKGSLCIIGGDFNTPPDPSVQNVLRPWLEDAFNEAGVGWGNTAVNDYPLVRIDQIWHSKHFKPKRVWSVKTVNSDHRMVVADFDIR